MTKLTMVDEHQHGWDAKYREQASGEAWNEQPQPRVREFLTGVSQGSMVADLGAGDGRNSKVAVELGHQVVMLDVSPTALDLALAKFNGQILSKKPVAVVGPLEDMPLADGQFDAALCMDCLPQVKNLERAIAEIHRILKPKGLCLVNVFSKEDCAWGEGERVGPSSYVYKGCYFSFFDEQDLPELCSGRFNVVNCERLSWNDPPHVPFRPHPHRHDAFFFVLQKS